MAYETPQEKATLEILGRIADALEKISFVLTLNCKPYVVTAKPSSSTEAAAVTKPKPFGTSSAAVEVAEKPTVEAPSVAPDTIQSANDVSLPVDSEPIESPKENLLERYGQQLKAFLNRQASKFQKGYRIVAGWFRTPPPAKAAPTGFTISGNAGTAGVGTGIITLTWDHDGEGVLTTQTDADGNFSFSNLTPGRYTVMPLLVGEYFVPPYREVEVIDSDIDHIDFVDPPVVNRSLTVSIHRQ